LRNEDFARLIDDATPALRTVMEFVGARSWEDRDGAIFILKPKNRDRYIWVEVPEALLKETGRIR
jgi:hypothetical protein